MVRSTSVTERALLVALSEFQDTGTVPTISELCRKAGVSRSSAYRAQSFMAAYNAFIEDPMLGRKELGLESEIDSLRAENQHLYQMVKELSDENKALKSLLLENL